MENLDKRRAEKAEAEIKRLKFYIEGFQDELEEYRVEHYLERTLADQLAEALRLGGQHEGPCDPDSEWEGCEVHYRTAQRRTQVALAAWKEARHEN